jgi:predicted transcriptional regulator of viral defense system
VPIDRRDLRRRLFTLAAEQGGYFTAAQAKGLGYSYQAQAHHVAAGNWHRVDRGLFRLAEWVPELHDDLRRWSLWSKGRAVVSNETALAVHEVGEFESARVHLTVPPGFTMTDDALVLHHADLSDIDVVEQAGFRITTVARSLADIATAGADEEQLGRAIRQATEAGLTTLRQLRARAEAVDPRGALAIERAISRLESK